MFDLVLENGNLITMNDNNDKSYTYPLSDSGNILCICSSFTLKRLNP